MGRERKRAPFHKDVEDDQRRSWMNKRIGKGKKYLRNLQQNSSAPFYKGLYIRTSVLRTLVTLQTDGSLC